MKKQHILLGITAIIASFYFTSCEKEEDTAKPEILSAEIGYENNKTGYLGTEFHIEAEVVADGKIDNIKITIHPEGEHEHKSTSSDVHEEEWEFDSTYTEFTGLKNTTFHKHIDVPLHADTGHYHFHFIVTDMEGNQTEMEEELKIHQPDDSEAPELTIASAPSNGQTFASGEIISISGSVIDDKALGGMYIGLVREDQNLTDSKINATNTITLLHTHDFDSPDSHSFSANIEVGAAQDNNITPKDITGDIAWQSANYYILVKAKDAFGGNWAFSEHYPIVINY